MPKKKLIKCAEKKLISEHFFGTFFFGTLSRPRFADTAKLFVNNMGMTRGQNVEIENVETNVE